MILTVSRIDAEKRSNPGYRAFLANGFNVTRALALFFWEVVLEWTAAIRAIRRDVRPQGPSRREVSPYPRHRLRRHPRPDRLRRAHRHDARATRGVRDVLELRRGRPPLRPSARRHAGGPAQARPADRADRTARGVTRRGRTRSSCCPITARPRARPSSSATATASTSSSSARSPWETSPSSRAGTSRRRWSATPSRTRWAATQTGSDARVSTRPGRSCSARGTSGSST